MAWLLLAAAHAAPARAAQIDVVPADPAQVNIAKIEGALSGDEVVVHPGTYKFRLYLEGKGTAAAPIVIRAADPQNRPVWDLDGDITENWPGSYSGGDRGRAIWHIVGSYYAVSGIVFRHGTDGQANGSGLRFKGSDHASLRDCLFENNDNGVQGAGASTLIEFCEFSKNGDPSLSEGSHNLYIHGGEITVRYSYIHDALQAENIHIRANDAVFEYNWMARGYRYMGDMMTCTIQPCDPVQRMLLRGNVFIRGNPTNDAQEFVLYNDQGTANVSFELTMINNTFIGNGDGAALVHFVNDTGDIGHESAVLDNNVVMNLTRAFWVNNPGLGNTTQSGKNNWLSAGIQSTTGLTGSVTGADPGFTDAAKGNFVPAAGSALVGAADATPANLPDKEYYRDEALPMMWRKRLTAHDIGAFESSTKGPGTGPYGGGGSSSSSGSGGGTTGSASSGGGAAGSGGGGDPGGTSGCGCRVEAFAGAEGAMTALSAMVALFLVRSRGRSRRERRW